MNPHAGDRPEHAADQDVITEPKAHGGRLAMIRSLSIGALLCALAAVGGGAWLWWRMTSIQQQQQALQDRLGAFSQLEATLKKTAEQQQSLAERFDHLAKQVNNQLAGLQRRQRPLDQTISQLRQELKNLQAQHNSLAARLASQGAAPSVAEIIDGQRLLEVGFLLRNAQITLALTRDIEQVIHLLDLADAQLAALGEPRWLPVRQAISRNKAALEAVPLVDTSGIALRLAAMAQEAHSWPLKASALHGTANNKTDSPQEPLQGNGLSWEKLRRELARLWHRLVIVSRVESDSLPAQPYLRERLALHLQLAASAAARRDQRLFAGELTQCRTLLMALDTTSHPVQQALKDIAAWQTVILEPTLPDLHGPLERFLHILQERGSQPTSPPEGPMEHLQGESS